MRSIFRDHADLSGYAGDLVQLVAELVAQHDALDRLERNQRAARGYPRRSMGERTSPGTVLDDQGIPMPAVSDPTGEAVIAGDQLHTQIAARRQTIEHHLVAARKLIVEATDGARKLTLPPIDLTTGTGADDLWCEHHLKHGMCEPRGSPKDVGRHGQHCVWCHAWNREHGQLPPRRILERRAAGERITTRVIDEVLGRTG